MFNAILSQTCRWPCALAVRTLTSHFKCQATGRIPSFFSTQRVIVPRRALVLDRSPADVGQKSMTPTDIQRRVLRICHEYDKIQETSKGNITLATHLIKDLGLDSLDHIEVLLAIENEFGFEIPDADYSRLHTIQAVVDYSVKRMNLGDHSKPVV